MKVPSASAAVSYTHRRGRHRSRAEGGRRRPRTEQPPPVPAQAGTRVPIGPAEPAGALPEAGGKTAGTERQPGDRPHLGLVARPQFDRIDAALLGELIERRLQRERPRRLTGGAHEGRARHIEPYDPVGGVVGGSVVQHPGHTRARLDELVHRRGAAQARVLQCAQPSLGIGTQPDPLGRGTPVTGQREQLAARHHHADRAREDGRRHHRGHLVRTDPLAPEAAADVFGPHTHRGRIEREEIREFARDPPGALVGVHDLEPAAVPQGGRRMGLHRVVVLLRRGVLGVQNHGGRRQFGLQVTLPRHSRPGRTGQRVRLRVLAGEGDVVRLLLVPHHQCLGGFPRLLGGLGDDQRDRPARVRHPVVLEDGDSGIRPHSEHADVVQVDPRGVPVVQDGEDARHLQDRRGPHRADTAAGDRRQHQPSVRELRERDLARVTGRSGDLVAALHAGVRGADGLRRAGRCRGHRVASSASSLSTATTRLRISVTL